MHTLMFTLNTFNFVQLTFDGKCILSNSRTLYTDTSFHDQCDVVNE